MSDYNLYFSDPSKTTNIVVKNTTNGTGVNDYDTSLDLVGSGFQNYGNAIAQNFLKLLENFSGPNAPKNAIEGQLWYDTSNPSRKVLKVNNGSVTSIRWRPVGGIYQQSNNPTIGFSSIVTDGDIWVDTNNGQLKIRFAGSWIVVGPTTSNGNDKTGSEVAFITSTNDIQFPVILNWANGQVVEIISYNEFTPKFLIDGFYTIKAGTNLTSKILARYNGIADKASALQTPSGSVINASEVLRNNVISQTHTGTFIVESGNGLIVRNSLYNKSLKLFNDISGSYIDASDVTSKLKIGLGNSSYLSFNGLFNNIGINTSTTSASPTLDVNGGARFSGELTILGLSSSTNVFSTNGTISINGDINSLGQLNILGDSNLRGILTLGSSTNVDSSILMPYENDSYDIGSTSTAFRNLYVSEIGNTTTFTILYGRVAGSADRLTFPRTFGVNGQITSSPVIFNGDDNAIIDTIASYKLISEQVSTTATTITQTLIVCDEDTSALNKIQKANFLSDVYPNLLLTGMISAYTTSTVPSGFLLCNGTSYSQVTYNRLYSVIGNTYGGSVGTFRVPDLTGNTDNSGFPIYYIIRT